MWIAAEQRWPTELRELGLEQVNMELFRDPCGLDVDAGESTPGVQERAGRVAAAMHGVFGRNWGALWLDGCDRGRLKIGVPLGPRDELVREMTRARRVLVERNVDDFVAVPTSSPALAAAQKRIHTAGVGSDEDLFSSQAHSLNAVHVEVARDVDADGWQTLTRVAKASGVNVILERTDSDEVGIKRL